jgi:hypothetical protein
MVPSKEEEEHKNKQITGNAGLFYVAYKLSTMGWNVLPTSRNAKGIDIVAYSEDFKVIRKIQVKSFSKIQAVSFGRDKETLPADFYVMVSHVYTKPEAYILTAEDVRGLLTQNKSGYWLEIKGSSKEPEKGFKKEEFKEKWDKIGYGWANYTDKRS